MRWILISLVAMNILAFAYFQLVPEDSDVPVSQAVVAEASGPVKEVQLLSEVPERFEQNDGQGRESVNKPAPPSAPETRADRHAVNSKSLCTLVGAFKILLKAEYFSERLEALGLTADIQNIAVTRHVSYWLHLSPEVSRKDALRRLRELQGRGIDSYVIPSGDLENGISLGMFSKYESAVNLKSKIISQGYDPKLIEVPREKKEIWVVLPQGEAAKLSAELWSELLSSDEYLQKKQNFCSDLASL